MNNDAILSQIEDEIDRLTRVRSLLAVSSTPAKRRPGRPKGTGGAPEPKKKSHGLSPAGRAKIFAAQKKRWAAKKGK